MLDLDSLTLSDIALIEEKSGVPLDAMGDDDSPKGKLMAAMAFVALRKRGENPTWTQVMNMTMGEVSAVLADAEGPDPKPEKP